MMVLVFDSGGMVVILMVMVMISYEHLFLGTCYYAAKVGLKKKVLHCLLLFVVVNK